MNLERLSRDELEAELSRSHRVYIAAHSAYVLATRMACDRSVEDTARLKLTKASSAFLEVEAEIEKRSYRL